MLTVSPAAMAALARVMASPAIPDGAGLRLSQGSQETDASGIAVSLVEEPEPGDDWISAGESEIYLDPETSELLEEHFLDAEVLGQHVNFVLRRRSLSGWPIGWG